MPRNNEQIPYAIDVVFCIDVSESMFYGVQKLRYNIDSMCKSFIEKTERCGNRIVASLRVRFVIFRDYLSAGKDAIIVTDFMDYRKDGDCVSSIVDKIKTHDGMCTKRSGLEALTFAMHSNWFADDSCLIRYRRVIMAFSNSSTHELGECRHLDHYPKGIPSSFEDLTAYWHAMRVNKLLFIAAPYKSGWKRITDEWENVILFPINTADFREINFCEIPDIICTTFEL